MASAGDFGTGPGCSINVARTQSPVIVSLNVFFYLYDAMTRFSPRVSLSLSETLSLSLSLSLSLPLLLMYLNTNFSCMQVIGNVSTAHTSLTTATSVSQTSPCYNYSVKIMNPKKSEFETVQMKAM